MHKFIALLSVLLVTVCLPTAYSWVVFDSRNDMLAMSSETDAVAVRVPPDSSEEVKKDVHAKANESEEDAAQDKNKSETEEADSSEKDEPKLKGQQDIPKLTLEEVENDETTEPHATENEIAEDSNKDVENNETTTEAIQSK